MTNPGLEGVTPLAFFRGGWTGKDRLVFVESFFGLSLLGRAVGPRIFWLALFPGRCPVPRALPWAFVGRTFGAWGGILDFGFWILDFGFWVLGFGF